MSGSSGYRSRKTRYEKRRINTKMINWLSIVGVILVLVIISISIFGNKDDKDKLATQEEQNKSEQQAMETGIDPVEELEEEVTEIPIVIEDETLGDMEQNGEVMSEEESEVVITSVESDDPNVKLAYEGNWNPVGTEQTGPHTIQFEKESQDWKEMMMAVEEAIGIPEEDQIQWWVGRAGDEQVEVTTSSKSNQEEIYRVHLQWVDNEGWQPILVEELIENDAPTATSQKDTSEQVEE